MRYVMRQKLLSLTDSYVIRDESGAERFNVAGKLISLGQQWHFDDTQGNELAFIRQKLISLTPSYEIYRGDRLAAVVHKKLFTLIRAKFTVDVPGPDDLEAQGSFTEHEYTIYRGNTVIAEVSKKWISLTDTYGVAIAQGEDDVLILATAVVIDAVCHPDHNRE